MLDALETVDVQVADEGDGNAVALSTGGTSDAVHIVLGIVGHVVVDDTQNVVDVDASRHNVGSHEHIHLSGLELQHDFVAFALVEVAVHLGTVYLHALQPAGNVLHLVLLA